MDYNLKVALTSHDIEMIVKSLGKNSGKLTAIKVLRATGCTLEEAIEYYEEFSEGNSGNTPETGTVNFLDYEISNTGNGDGWVLSKVGTSYTNLWERHLGNFTELETAKKYAVQNFMVARPVNFHAQVVARMNGTQIYHDWFTFEKVLEEEGIEWPEEIGMSVDGNCTLTFNDEVI